MVPGALMRLSSLCPRAAAPASLPYTTPPVRRTTLALVGLLLLGSCTSTRGPESFDGLIDGPIEVASPDGLVVVTLAVGPSVEYAVEYAGEAVLLPSSIDLSFVDAPALRDLAVRDVERRSEDATWEPVWGKRAEVRDHYNEVTLRLVEAAWGGRPLDLVVRAYDDGVAFRYRFPEAWGDALVLGAEDTRFRFAGEPTVWAANFGGFISSQERPFIERPLASLAPDSVYGMPLLVKAAGDRWAVVTEADLTDWAGMYAQRVEGEPGAIRTVLSPHLGEPEVAVRVGRQRASPWRVVMLAETPAALLESDLVRTLNDPPAGDFSWVRPGVASWDWWNGPWLPDADFEVGMNTQTMKAYVDLADEMDWAYVLVDAGWYGDDYSENADITSARPELDLADLIDYADQRGVRVLLWLHWGHVAAQMAEAFAAYEAWGVAGVKIDYLDRDDQEMVRFYHRVAEAAARHRLIVNFHGAYKPTGVSRTYPNLVTREGVLGNEYNKWSTEVTPEHTVTIPFTRGLLGEMDFTPGGFRNVTVSDFRPTGPPLVMGTRARQLAMFVVYESALTVASDSPHAYATSPAGTDVLRGIPTTWDDTRALAGYPGDAVAVARRSGDTWYVAAMTDEEARTLDLPLDFLPAGRFRLETWADSPAAATDATDLVVTEQTVTADDELAVVMAPAGGLVARLTPVGGARQGVPADAEAALPLATALHGVRPNPSGRAASVSYALAGPADVRVAIYDALGRSVATLADGPRTAGEHEVAFDASDLPAGVYLIRLEAVGDDGAAHVETRRLTFVR